MLKLKVLGNLLTVLICHETRSGSTARNVVGNSTIDIVVHTRQYHLGAAPKLSPGCPPTLRRKVVSGDFAGTVRIWLVETGQLVFRCVC